VNYGVLAGVSAFALLGAVIVQFPSLALGIILAVVLSAVLWRIRPLHLELWKGMALTAVGFYMILNYGFENIAFRVGPIPVVAGETLMFGAFAMVLFRYRGALSRVAHDPCFICLMILLGLSVLHLLRDVPRFGLYAFRDASIYVESLFFIIGSVWAMEKKNTQTLLKWFTLVFLANTVYNALFPFSKTLKSLSPQSGVFQPVPIIGFYDDSPLYLVAGALFFLWLGKGVTGKSRVLLWIVAAIQLCELGLLQTRSAYVGLGLILLSLLALGEASKARQVISIVLVGVLGLVVLVTGFTMAGVTISGRVGPVDMSFLKEHAETIFMVNNQSARWETDGDRLDWYGQVWQLVTASSANMVWGVGFGDPLIEFPSTRGRSSDIAVRQPHNTSLSVLGRLGLTGLAVWLAFHFFILRSFYKGLRARSRLDDVTANLILLLFCLYLLFMVTTSVQPLLEFSHGAVPFFFLMGIAMGIVRWQVFEVTSVRRVAPAFAKPIKAF
jgi:O-antigen ligase